MRRVLNIDHVDVFMQNNNVNYIYIYIYIYIYRESHTIHYRFIYIYSAPSLSRNLETGTFGFSRSTTLVKTESEKVSRSEGHLDHISCSNDDLCNVMYKNNNKNNNM